MRQPSRRQSPTRMQISLTKAEVAEEAFMETLDMLEEEGVKLDKKMDRLDAEIKANGYTFCLKKGENNGREERTRQDR